MLYMRLYFIVKLKCQTSAKYSMRDVIYDANYCV